MPTLILHPRYDEDSQLLWQEAVTRGWSTERLDGYHVPSDVGLRAATAEQVVLYGGGLWGEHVAEQLQLSLVSPPHDWLVMLPRKFTWRWRCARARSAGPCS